MSINKKIMVALLSILTLTLFISGSFIYQLKDVDATYSRVIDSMVPVLNNAADISTEVGKGGRAIQDYLVGDANAEANYTQFQNEIVLLIDSIDRVTTKPESRKMIEQVQTAYVSYVVVLDEVLALAKAGDNAAAITLFQTEGKQAEQTLVVQSENLHENMVTAFNNINVENTAATNTTIYTALLAYFCY